MAADGKVALSLSEMLECDKRLSRQVTEEEPSAPKKSFQPYHAQSVPKSEDLEAVAFVRQSSGDTNAVTTMMLRNIPNKYTQNSLLQEINDLGFAGTFDFFYLPMDVHNRSNVGYAFINFLQPDDAEHFRQKFSDHRFQRFQSRKISSVCTAHVQGLHENLRHFENRAVTHARNDQYRPVVLRNGVRVDLEDVMAEGKSRSQSTVSTASPSSKRDDSPDLSGVEFSRCASKDSTDSANVGTSGPAATRSGRKERKNAQKSGSGYAGNKNQAQPQAAAGPGRQGLETAIRGLIGPGNQKQANPDLPNVAPPPGLGGRDAPQDPAAALVRASQAAEAGQGQGGNDIMQLIGLRSLILDRLLQKDGVENLQAYQHAASLLAMQVQQERMRLQSTPTLNPASPPFSPVGPRQQMASKWEEPAYIELSPAWGYKTSPDAHYTDADMPTPRTRELLLQSSLRGGYGLDDAWKL